MINPRFSMVLEYLPTFAPKIVNRFVGQYSSTIKHLGVMISLVWYDYHTLPSSILVNL